jgi:hypothetical protein
VTIGMYTSVDDRSVELFAHLILGGDGHYRYVVRTVPLQGEHIKLGANELVGLCQPFQ